MNSNEISGIQEVTLELKNKLNKLNEYAKDAKEEIDDKRGSIQTIINEITINSSELLEGIRKDYDTIVVSSDKLLENIREDYESLKDAIIDENIPAELQNQINEINKELLNKPNENEVKEYIQEAIEDIDFECSCDGSDLNVDLSKYQTKEDADLETTNKTVIGAINELLELVQSLIPVLPVEAPMFYGYIPFESSGVINSFNDITLEMLENAGDCVVSQVNQAVGKVSTGMATEGSLVIVAVPEAFEYRVTKDNGFGEKVLFDTDVFGANGVTVVFNDIEYKLYGELMLTTGELFIYID